MEFKLLNCLKQTIIESEELAMTGGGDPKKKRRLFGKKEPKTYPEPPITDSMKNLTGDFQVTNYDPETNREIDKYDIKINLDSQGNLSFCNLDSAGVNACVKVEKEWVATKDGYFKLNIPRAINLTGGIFIANGSGYLYPKKGGGLDLQLDSGQGKLEKLKLQFAKKSV